MERESEAKTGAVVRVAQTYSAFCSMNRRFIRAKNATPQLERSRREAGREPAGKELP